ncbi:hypothetical protein ABZ260_09545 [Streptosporangium sp. NPDC006013]|uniref:hypothetical protein n=1 Tax=Streptosporangium sp. NPDC006013 TaxID=3155596 RepID=UPI0033B539E7
MLRSGSTIGSSRDTGKTGHESILIAVSADRTRDELEGVFLLITIDVPARLLRLQVGEPDLTARRAEERYRQNSVRFSPEPYPAGNSR